MSPIPRQDVTQPIADKSLESHRAASSASIERLLVDAVYGQNATLIAGMLNTVLTGLVAWWRTGADWLLLWALVSFVVYAGRLVQAACYRRRSPDSPPALWAWRFTIGAWLSAALWGAASLVVVTENDPFAILLILTVQIGVVAAASARNNSVPKAAMGVVPLTILPLAITCFATGDVNYIIFGCFTLTNAVATIATIRHLAAQTIRLLQADEKSVLMAQIENQRALAEAGQRQSEERQALIAQQVRHFEDVISASLETLTSSARRMRETSVDMTATAEETDRTTTAAADAARAASVNVQTVAAATEQLNASVHEITCQVGQSSAIAVAAVDAANDTNTIVHGLADAAGKIGDVLKLIRNIAGRTNLLALNATIEAARAGEAGRGFAVVASEVKNLANQTEAATDSIAQQISAIQTATTQAVTAIAGICTTIDTMSRIAGTIAAAVEQQGAATREIAGAAQQAAQSTVQVSRDIATVNHAAARTGSAAGEVRAAAESLGDQASSLANDVEQFLGRICAA